jgi:hypothetical protein
MKIDMKNMNPPNSLLLSQSGVNPAGASLLAMAMAQSTRRLKVMALSRAGSLLTFLRC